MTKRSKGAPLILTYTSSRPPRVNLHVSFLYGTYDSHSSTLGSSSRKTNGGYRTAQLRTGASVGETES